MVRVNGHMALAALLALVVAAIPRPAHCQGPVGPLAPGFLEDRNGSLLDDDPALVLPETPMGWFAALSLEVVAPALKQYLQGDVTLGADTVTVVAPRTDLAWTAAPRLEAGYRFGAGIGELLVNYRPLAAEGRRDTVAPDGGPGRARTRLDFQLFILDYASPEFSLCPLWDMKTFVGVCMPTFYFDNRVIGAQSSLRTSNQYFGAGPHLGMEFWRKMPWHGLEAYARFDGMLTVGKNHQVYSASVPSPDGGQLEGEAGLRKVRESPSLRSAVGLSYVPPFISSRRLRFDLGYAIERWWYVGQTSVDGFPTSRGEVTVQGLFVRGEWGY